MTESKTILSLCDYSGVWSEPYKAAGYDVIRVDLQRGTDVRLLEYLGKPIHGILAAPPCTHFSLSGARWWKEKGSEPLTFGLSIVDACLRAVLVYSPAWWVLENPVGRLKKYLGKPAFYFNPCDFGDPYTKKTCLWGRFNAPAKSPVFPSEGSKIWLMAGNGRDTKNLRSQTPRGFAKAFFEANP